ncbi:hypothetical protein H0A36_01520 [Endozoicomonas sp. SM1973]|uniref:Uncharacterized protein n=1 Tax=Spartinivicinus marinus TaxID=2994442 RepID=A0A853IB67_9GAMM|nr:hypothetical protein [Spartinivicinus marinus]MCX4030089.1 hypothetical protein [Spartinivicinus marinus]NYZ64666.1 hypothetical protein [Spartinivicinus marinus]
MNIRPPHPSLHADIINNHSPASSQDFSPANTKSNELNSAQLAKLLWLIAGELAKAPSTRSDQTDT